MPVRTLYELRVTILADGSAGWSVPSIRYDELQFDSAQQAFTQNVAHAKRQLGTERTFTTNDGNEYQGSPHTICVELWHYKAGKSADGSPFATRPAIVGESETDHGMREVITQRGPK